MAPTASETHPLSESSTPQATEAIPDRTQNIASDPEPTAPAAAVAAKPASRTRTTRKFPALPFEEALFIPNLIQQIAAGQRVRRLTLFEHLDQSPDSKKSRALVTAASQYGLTVGSYTADYLELTPEGAQATNDDVVPAVRFEVRFGLAIEGIPPFNFLYERFKNNKVPVRDVLIDSLSETEIDETDRAECADTFIVNLKFLGMLRTIGGVERIVTFDHALDDAKKITPSAAAAQNSADQTANPGRTIIPTVYVPPPTSPQALAPLNEEGGDYANTCFYITPIGEEDSEPRRHADFVMEYIVKPAMKEFGLSVIRADRMGKPGMIGKQLIEHILNARVVVADLSFHNPNVFYEICLRHTTRLPIVQLIRASDKIPFDVNQYRTIPIETRDPYTLLPKLQTYIAEVATQVRRALEDEEQSDNPISLYYPSAKLIWEGKP